jgi:hypothetical protein
MSIIELTFNGISLTDVDVAVEHTLSRTVDQALYYYPFPSSRAATILWGRLFTCGGLPIRLPWGAANPGCQSCLQPAFSQLLRQRDIRLPRIG